MRFSRWLKERERQDESILGTVGGAIGNVAHKISKAAKTAAWGASHPAQVPPQIAHAIAEEWKGLIEKYGTTEATVIFASLVIALGPGLMVPGSIALVWVTIGACKLFNHVVSKAPHNGKTQLSDEQVHQEVTRIKEDLLEKAKEITPVV